jgi:hypothetical protein
MGTLVMGLPQKRHKMKMAELEYKGLSSLFIAKEIRK